MVSRILVVDDNQDLADNLVEILAEFGHEAVAAYGASEALQAASQSAFDLALVDIRMPEMAGIELVKRLMQCAPCRAYLFMSAMSAEHAMTGGFLWR